MRAPNLAAALLTAALLLAGSARADEPAEYAVKAVFLYKLAAYVDWPPSAFESAASPVKLCVSGTDPFGDVLDKQVEGHHIGDRPITVQRLKTASREAGCHILYAAGSDAQSVAQALSAVHGAPVLTVTDAARGNTPGIIHFVLKDSHVRFEIDDSAAAANGLTISSKLLGLALSVVPKN
jgi:hypothetical protein